MSKVWEKFDMEIAATPMPEPYQNKMVSVVPSAQRMQSSDLIQVVF